MALALKGQCPVQAMRPSILDVKQAERSRVREMVEDRAFADRLLVVRAVLAPAGDEVGEAQLGNRGLLRTPGQLDEPEGYREGDVLVLLGLTQCLGGVPGVLNRFARQELGIREFPDRTEHLRRDFSRLTTELRFR